MTCPPDPPDDLMPLLRVAYPSPQPPANFSDVLLARVQQALTATPNQPHHLRRHWWPYLAVAASLTIAFALASHFLPSPASPSPRPPRTDMRKFADAPPSPEFQNISDIFYSKELTKDEKITQLKALTLSDKTRLAALFRLASLDEPQALQAALTFFRAKESPRELKLEMGRFLLKGDRPKSPALPAGFIDEYASYLIGAILDGGQAEFCRKLDGLTSTAVGEYALLAGNFEGYGDIDFTPFKDARLVPILIACLDAPDIVYPVNQGDVIRGKPGESTGRSGGGQIPIALARLADPRAIDPLKTILAQHHDIYFRMNAAYALARLIDKKEDRAAIGKTLLANPDLLWCRFPFGKGLIETGDDAGVEFLAIRHAGGFRSLEDPSSLFYVMDQRLAVLQGFKSPEVETFLREALSLKPFRAMLLFEPGSVKIEPALYTLSERPKDEAAALELAAPRIIKIHDGLMQCVETNKLKGLSADLEDIARRTRSEQIRERTRACLKALAQ